jgi:hypothetical protein
MNTFASIHNDQQLASQNTQQPWIDCNLRSRPRPHLWKFEQVTPGGRWYRCERCPVSTRVSGIAHGGSTGAPVYPPPFLKR